MKRQLILNYFFSKEWFRNLFSKKFFIKINGNWDMVSKDELEVFAKSQQKGQKVEELKGPAIHCWIYCQNDSCGNLLTFGNSFVKERVLPNEVVWDYKCKCCEKEQHFYPDFLPTPCDENGNILTAA